MDRSQNSPASALRCWVKDRRVGLELSDRRVAGFPASKYPLLARASAIRLASVRLRVKGRALRWESLDEDIWVDDAIHGRFPHTRTSVA